MEVWANFGVVTLILGILLVWLLLRNKKSDKIPPGPLALPIIGSLLSLRGNDIRETLLNLAHRYGDMFTIYMGRKRAVVLASFDVVKEVLVKNGTASSGRPHDNVALQSFTGKGVGMLDGQMWKTHRKMLTKFMRDKEVGRLGFENIVTEEIKQYLQVLANTGMIPHDPALLTQKAISNIINQVLFCRRFDYEDPQLTEMVESLDELFEIVANSGALSMFPWLIYVPGDLFKYHRLLQIRDNLTDHVRNICDEHKRTRVKGEIRDMIDAYLDEDDEWSGEDESPFSEEYTLHNSMGMFIAGTETVATTLRWLMIYFVIHPDVMSRVQKEIDDIIGPSRMASIKDRDSMPYTQAVILEAQRVADIVPLGTPHRITQDIHIRGYTIPEGTVVLPFNYAVHRDHRHWDEPYCFNPDRFLDDDGHFRADEEVITFGIGPRICLGKSLAEMELYLFLVALLQRFDLAWPVGRELPKLTGTLGITHTPESFEIKFRQR